MPQLDFIPIAVAKQLQQFEESGGKVIWVGQVPHGAEHVENDSVVLAALENKPVTPVDKLTSDIAASYSSAFDLTFCPGTEQLIVGRFHKDGRLVYLLVNRKQEAISVNVNGGAESVQVLDPSTGEIRTERLPVTLPIKGICAMLLIAE
jgi:hypothetical protein